MPDEKPSAETDANSPADAEPLTVAGGEDLPLHALAVAADPALAGSWGANVQQVEDVTVLSHGDMLNYDGHVAIALDAGLLPDMDSTLDQLIFSHDLFDIPAMDIGAGADDVSQA